MRTDVSRSLRNSPQFAGVSAGSNADVRSLPLAEVAIASILAAGLWALQTRSWRATELHMAIVVMKAAEDGCRYDAAHVLDGATDRSVFVKRPMSPQLIIIGGVLRQNPA